MEVSELLAGLDAEIGKQAAWINDLRTELADAERRLDDARREAAAVRSAVQRLSGEAGTPTARADTSWRGLSHVDAVEAALREAGRPLHLSEIANAVASHGHVRMPKAKVSATLTHLSQLRGTVVSLGKGRWDYIPPAPALRVVRSPEELPSQGDSPGSAVPVADTGSPIA